MQLTERYADKIKDFDRGYGHEAMARGGALAGRLEEARHQCQQAAELGARIQDEEDRTIFLGDLHAGPWFALEGSFPNSGPRIPSSDHS